MRAKLLHVAIACPVLALGAGAAHAQHATDNPVATADDGFGLTLGLESIGMYGPGNIRGFNPQAAGNVRVDGLYFDQQGGLSNRVVEGSTIRVGVSEIGYAFPAPTGIVDYDLRRTGDGKATGSLVASVGPFQQVGLSADEVVPLVGKDLQVPIGIGYEISDQTPYSSNPGYTSYYANFGATPEWRVNDRWRVRAIFDWSRTTDAKTMPFVFTAGDFEPPQIPHVYYGQNWALGNSLGENYGAIVHGTLSEHWSLSAGLFRSVSDSPVSYSDLYVNTQRNGYADHLLVAYPDQFVGSTSGEARVTGRIGVDSWIHHLVLLLRGRDTRARYGGSDTVDAGTARVGQEEQLPKPDFHLSGTVADRTRLWGTGIAWRGQWQGRGDFSLGLQKESYDKAVTPPGGTQTRLDDRPLRAYGQASLALSERVTAYAGATQGLEDSGTAPTGAANHGAILPDARTWQVDAGARYAVTKDLKFILGVFEIEKPYFNLDTDNVDRQLAVQRAKGIEFSSSGAIGKDLHFTIGALLGEVSVLGPDLHAEGIGPFAFGQPHFQTAINVDYAFTPALSADVAAFRFGTAPVSLDDQLRQPPQNFLALGGRYRFQIGTDQATLRVQMQNANNYQLWNFAYTPGFAQFPGRVLFGYLTVDI
jgi:iron complex outermembrane receptor protein